MNILRQVLLVLEHMSKKTIVHLIQSLDSGGCENMLLRTLPLMKKFNHIIVTLNRRGGLADKFEKKGIRVININQKSLVDLFSYRRLKLKLKEISPSLIITYLFHADLIGRLYVQSFINCKVIPFLRTTYNHKNYWQARLFETITKSLVYKYIANSEAVKDFYVHKIGVSKNKIIVIPNGIDVDYYNSIPKDYKLRTKLGIKQSDKVIICVANFHINKGHKYLLEAFEQVYKKYKNIKLLLVGDGSEKENLKNQIKFYDSKNNIIFLGKRDDVPYLLKISNIFVLPTLFEGMSNSILEAMACGLPIIATNIPENIYILNDNSALLVPIKNSHALSHNIVRLITNHKLRSFVENNAKRKANINFDLDNIARILSKEIDEL